MEFSFTLSPDDQDVLANAADAWQADADMGEDKEDRGWRQTPTLSEFWLIYEWDYLEGLGLLESGVESGRGEDYYRITPFGLACVDS